MGNNQGKSFALLNFSPPKILGGVVADESKRIITELALIEDGKSRDIFSGAHRCNLIELV